MGVYYGCSSCGVTLHLAPGAPGFGQLRIDCPKCGSEARYSPSGPKGGDVVDVGGLGADAARPDRPSISPAMLSSVLGTSAKVQGPSPTVPLQMSQDMLEQDRVETAQTIPVEGLTSSQLAALARRQPNDEIARTERVEGIGPLVPASPSDTARDYDPTTQMPGLSADMLSNHAPDDIPEVPLPLPSAVEPAIDGGSGPLSDVDEDKIPTRSLEGLSDREVKSYARELYTQEGTLEPTGSVEGLSGVTADDKIAAFKAERAAERAAAVQAPVPADEPSFDMGAAGGGPELEPALSPSMFVNSPMPGGAEPRLTGANPRVVSPRSEPGLYTAGATPAPETLAADFRGPTRQPPGRSTLRRGASVGIVFVTVFLLALVIFVVGGLVVWLKSSSTTDVAPNEKVEKEEVVPRHTRFALPALDSTSPFRVGTSSVAIRDTGGGFATVEVSGTIENGGINSIDEATLAGTLAIALSEGESQSFPMTGSLKPKVGRKRAWAPGKAIKFTIQATQVPADAVAADATDRFIWLTLKARNGSVFTYDEAFAVVEVKK
jgi:hypothetical protein